MSLKQGAPSESWPSTRSPPEGSVLGPPPPPAPVDTRSKESPERDPLPPPPPQKQFPSEREPLPSGAHLPETSTVPSSGRPVNRLTPERLKKLGLREGMDLRNTDV